MEKFEEGDLIHKKIAAMELIKELQKEIAITLVAVFGCMFVAASPTPFNYIVAAIVLTIVGFVGVKAYQYKQYLENKYTLPKSKLMAIK